MRGQGAVRASPTEQLILSRGPKNPLAEAGTCQHTGVAQTETPSSPQSGKKLNSQTSVEIESKFLTIILFCIPAMKKKNVID